MFKNYVPTKDKKCTMSFKDKSADELLTLDQVKKYPEYAGVLDDDTVLIDVDDEDASEILLSIVENQDLKCRVYKTTRGKHFLFKRGEMLDKCYTHQKTAIGIPVDVKSGNKNCYEVLKFNGREREILYDILPGEDYDVLPKWLTIVPVKELSFLDMKSGDGRNQALFNYILTLQGNGFTVEDIKTCITIINNFVMKDPLDDKELSVIMRDDAFKKPVFFNKGNFLFDKFSVFMRNECHVIRINGNLHIYQNGVYVAGKNAIMSKMIEYIPTLKSSQRKEVLDYLELIVDEADYKDTSNYICFKNGIYDITTDELLPFSPEIIVTNKINHNYNPDATSEILETMLNNISCGDAGIRSLLEEMAGYCMYRRNELRKAFILTGDKKNGKSTYLDMVTRMLGDNNISALDLSDLCTTFRPAEIVGKLANIGDDIGDEFIKNPAIFKKVVSGDRITVEKKGADPFQFSNYAKLLFSANDIPRIKDKSGAVIDRLIIIPFNATFDKNSPDFDPFIKYKLRKPDVIEAFIQLALDGLCRVLTNQEFTTTEAVTKELEEYELNNNPVLLFFKEHKVIDQTSSGAYRDYRMFCVENNYNPMSQIEFSKTVRKTFGCHVEERKIDGKRVRVFVK
ncbi:MAG: hypothetical protein J6T10_27120 [Methanobrevibacter sp.]|nr:hypothetical protein [Methanobrevibacter sp.]